MVFYMCVTGSDLAGWPDLQWRLPIGHWCRHGVWQVSLSLCQGHQAEWSSTASVLPHTLHSLVFFIYWCAYNISLYWSHWWSIILSTSKNQFRGWLIYTGNAHWNRVNIWSCQKLENKLCYTGSYVACDKFFLTLKKYEKIKS